MKTFEYVGFTSDGRRARGIVEADGPKAARERLAAQGVLVERLRAAGDSAAQRSRRRPAMGHAAVRAAIFRELASLLRAGLPVARALDVLIESPELAGARSDLAAARDRIREGTAFSDALEAGGRVTPFETAAFRAGERAGALDVGLERVADYLETQARIRERIVSALIYPAVVLTLTALVAIGMLGFLLPTLARLWDDAGVELPAFTRAVMALGRAARWALPTLIVATVITVAAIRRRATRSAEWRERVDRWRYRLPVAGPLYRALAALRFARALALLLRGGAPLVEALPLAGRATGSPWAARGVEAAAEAVRHGRSPADALREVPPLRDAIPNWVHAGEASGDLVRLLTAAADRQQFIWERKLGRALALLEPALVILLGALVLTVALAIVLPILALHRGIA